MPFFKKSTVTPNADGAAKPAATQSKFQNKVHQPTQSNSAKSGAKAPKMPTHPVVQTHMKRM